ncbi:MAG: Fic family protein [Tissierellia bacterium]|nr:Fic family protein [Tissierellia bacterium]
MFEKDRAGKYKKNLSGKIAYHSFQPAKLPPSPAIEIDDKLMRLLIEAHKKLAVLDERATSIPDIDLFISMYVQKEALLSSQIEGTQATLEDLFDPTIDANIHSDVNDVVNYTKATKYAIRRLRTLPLCNRLLLETHRELMSGVRGQDKNPGEFRQSQNWIGGFGSTLKTARYIPPSEEDMKEALSDLEKYIHKEDGLDVLIKAALIHYQFESIHPFLDGNGRIGRLLIILFLLEQQVIHSPALYISYYLKLNRTEYYDRMTEVRETGNYEQWIDFFVRAVKVAAESAINTAEELITLKIKNEQLLEKQGYTKRTLETMQKIFRYLQSYPIIEIPKTARELELSYNTVASGIRRFEDLGILRKLKEQERNRAYIYDEYLSILRTGTEI